MRNADKQREVKGRKQKSTQEKVENKRPPLNQPSKKAAYLLTLLLFSFYETGIFGK
jgi:hypothetical protein